MRELLEKLLEHEHLTEGEAAEVLRGLASGEVAPALAGALLAALRVKGVVAAELRGFATAMRSLARRPHIPRDTRALDIVGTGGDRSGSLNLSTGAALLTAACGVSIVKHGNRSVSSRSGSADVLEALGLPLPLDETAAGECLAATGFTFLFAPHYHPAMKAIAPVRAALGVRTIFNVLGPLTNPAAPPLLLVGAFDLEVAGLMAEALSGMDIERAFVVHGAEGWDEPTPIGPFELYDVRPGRIERSQRSPCDYGVPPCAPQALAGSDAVRNARALGAALRGEDRGPHRDALLMGAALALELAEEVRTPAEGLARAAQAIDGGAASRMLAALAEFGAHRPVRST